MSDDEEKLKRAFSALKAEDAKKAPAFRTIVDRGAPKTRSPWVVLVPLASTAAIAAVFLVWCGTSTMSAPAPTAAPVAANQKNQPADETARAAAGGESAAAAAGGKKASAADGITAAVADFHPPPDPAPLDFLLALPGSSALATNTALDLPVLR